MAASSREGGTLGRADRAAQEVASGQLLQPAAERQEAVAMGPDVPRLLPSASSSTCGLRLAHLGSCCRHGLMIRLGCVSDALQVLHREDASLHKRVPLYIDCRTG